MVHQPYLGSFEVTHSSIHQGHRNPRVPDHVTNQLITGLSITEK
jgi:hypothetical protein